MKAFKKPFSFEGRLNRKDFIIAFVTAFVMFIFLALTIGIGVAELLRANTDIQLFFIIISAIPSFLYIIASGAKRLHDVGLSGWMQLIYPVSIFIILFKRGQEYDNQYGENIYEIQLDKSSINNSTMLPIACPVCKNPTTSDLKNCEWCGTAL